ncbi:kinesin-like protein KIF19 isoform X2 [Eurytemora carolleeae]|uniref:kinesin-like protein KIF19 isoform X2 n=1 Tax=Eurytemora carolleeae TaxID=1294199 RepID=UPI000C768026|nr:kinesin-like protein KIF19 isoform X2 [Eurytemora carolleeae]|eukprot:XP_023325995.1 kinesin-like protein KIF19 isoform X2 [Eurytemora affinis]
MKRRSRRSDDGGGSSSSSHSKKEKSRGSRDKDQSKRSEDQEIDEPEARGEVNNEKLMVALRIRPLKQEEISRGYRAMAERVDSKMVLLTDPGSRKNDVLRKNRNPERQYIFDKAFGPDSTQEEVYNETTKHLVQNVIEGYNATVFAYGATGGGKTYTMVGTQDQPLYWYV